MTDLLEQITPSLIEALGVILTFVISAAAWQVRKWTGLNIEEKHRKALHEAIMSGVQSAAAHGLEEGSQTFLAHVKAHARQSTPDAIKALVPGDGVLDAIAVRYARQVLKG